MKLIDNPKTNRLCETFQANEMKFAFATENKDGDFQLIHTWVKCREYFNELLMKNYHPNEFNFDEVHGFVYDHANFPMDLSRTVLAAKFPSKELMDQFITNLPVMHKIEELNGVVDRTVIHQVTTHDNTVLVIASRFWIQKALLLNIYTLMMKLMCFEITEKSVNDIYQEYISNNKGTPSELNYTQQLGTNKINKLLENLDIIATVPTKYVDGTDEIRPAYKVHALSGILSLFKYSDASQPVFKNILDILDKPLKSRKKPVSILL